MQGCVKAVLAGQTVFSVQMTAPKNYEELLHINEVPVFNNWK